MTRRSKEDAPRQLANGDVVLHCPHLDPDHQFPNGTSWILFIDEMKVQCGPIKGRDRRPYDINIDWLVSCSRCAPTVKPREKMELKGWYHFVATARDVRRHRGLVFEDKHD